LVFYLPGEIERQKAVQRLESRGYKAVTAFNPYWDKQGKTFEDPHGYRAVLQNALVSVTKTCHTAARWYSTEQDFICSYATRGEWFRTSRV